MFLNPAYSTATYHQPPPPPKTFPHIFSASSVQRLLLFLVILIQKQYFGFVPRICAFTRGALKQSVKPNNSPLCQPALIH